MKKRTLKTLVITLCLSLSCIGIALAFDWPQKETAADRDGFRNNDYLK